MYATNSQTKKYYSEGSLAYQLSESTQLILIYINHFNWELIMIPRLSIVFEETVSKALKLLVEGDDFGAVAIMKDQGIPVKLIAMVLNNEHQIRSNELYLVKQYSE